MKTENFLSFTHSSRARPHSQTQHQPNSSQVLSSAGDQQAQSNSRRRRNSNGFSDRDSVCSVGSVRGKRQRGRNIPMKSSKTLAKKNKAMDYTNYAYNEAVGRLKLMLADSYATPKGSSSYLRHLNDDSGDNFSDTVSVIERPIFSDISKYLSPSQKSRMGGYRAKPKSFGTYCSSKENLALPLQYQSTATTATAPLDYYVSPKLPAPSDSIHAPVEIFSFIEKQEDYIEQLEKESKYCRNELTNLLGKVKDVINENEQLTETARSELAALSGVDKSCRATTSPSSDSDEHHYHSTKKGGSTPRTKNNIGSGAPKSPRYASAPNIVYEARISELEAELMQANIDLKRFKTENEELKRKLAHTDPLQTVGVGVTAVNCETHRKQIEHLQLDKAALEDSIRQLQRSLDEAKSQQYSVSSKRYINDLMQMERSQSELEVKHLREELDRQHERVRELQHEMARRVAEERANAERRYNTQVDQLGGDLSSQWEQVAKLQLELERQKRYESDTKRDLANRNAQIEELKMELRSNRNTFLADMAQVNAEKQSLEQEITALRLQLDRSAREAKTEAARLNAEISSLRQRLDRGDADLLHSKREVLRLNDEIANLEKELAYGELKNEIRPTKKDLDKRISEMQEKHEQTHPANFLYETPQTTATQENQQQTATTSKEGLKATATTTTGLYGTTSAPALTTTITTASGLCSKTNAFPLPTYETHSIIPPTTTTTDATTTATTTTTSVFPLAATTTTTTTHPSTVSANVCASSINEQADESNNNNHNNEDDDAVDDNAGDDVDDILANIRKSNRRLERELAKMPPLPKLPPTMAYKRHNSSNNKSSTNHTGNKCYHCRRRSAFGKANNCMSSSNNSSKDVCLCCTYNNDNNTYSNSNHNNTYSNNSNSNKITPLSGSKFSTPPNEPPCVRKTFYQTHHNQSVHTPPTTFANSITTTTETKNVRAPFSHNSHLQCITTRPQQQQQYKQHHHELTIDAHAKAKLSACRHLHELCRDRACTRTSATAETHLQSGSCSSRGYQRSGDCHFGGVASVCCQLPNCKTEPLPWLQQHLVLNQTFSGFEPTSVAAAATTGACSDCQSPSQATHLTDHTEHLTTKAPATEKTTTTTTTTTKTMKTSTATSSKYLQSPHGEGAYKPRSYFEELLRRDACCSKRASTHERCLEKETVVLREHCAKKPRPPVKVDVNVRLVPKPAKTAKAPKLAKESAEKRMERKNEELEKMESDIEQDLEQEEEGAVGGYDLPLDTVQLEDVDEPVDEQI